MGETRSFTFRIPVDLYEEMEKRGKPSKVARLAIEAYLACGTRDVVYELPPGVVEPNSIGKIGRLEIPKEVGVIERIVKPEVIEGKTCKHGKARGYNCGLCGGLAVIGE